MPDGNSELVRVVSCLEGELEEDQSGKGENKQFRRADPRRNEGSKGCGRESKGVCGSLKGPRKVRVRLPEPLPTLRLRPGPGGELRRAPKQQGEGAGPAPQAQAPAGCAHPGGGGPGRFQL